VMLSLKNQVKALIVKEFRQEFRQKYMLGGILLYMASTVFVCYLSFRSIIHPPTWNALFWIIMLFAATNAVAKSFIGESSGRQLYYYTLTSPQAVVISKMIYNTLLMVVISIVCFIFYSLFIKNIVQDMLFFFFSILIGSASFATSLTMVSAIASKSNNNFSLMAILGFPIMIPMLITIIKVSKYAVDGLDRSLSLPYFGVLGLIIILISTLSFILFPYLWRE
jgi:heme exporter protein B